MPVTSNVDEPLDYVAISGPAVDTMERRNESTSNPKIAAKELRQNLEQVKEALFADIKALVEAARRRATAHPCNGGPT